MKRFVFVERTDNRGRVKGNIFRIKNNNIAYVTNYEVNTASRRGGKHDAFNALMDCGEIPRKYEKSSSEYGKGWMGPGYFYGEVENLYDIKELF